MAASRRTRSLAAVGALAALIAPLALVASGEAAAAPKGLKTHQTKVYKVEKHVDIGGEYPDNYVHEHLSCSPGDIATDGMWRVDHVDQANPDTGTSGDERDVRVTSSYGDSSDWSKWHFEITNDATADAQVKLFLVCLDDDTTERDGHAHKLNASPQKKLAVASFDDDMFPYTQAECDPGFYAIAPGFNFPTGEARLFHSWPTADHQGWEWKFKILLPGATGDVTYRCLRAETEKAGPGPHTHLLDYDWYSDADLPKPLPAPHVHKGIKFTVDASETAEAQLSCKSHGKAIVGGFYFHPNYVWWLGQDPRPKTRAHKLWVSKNGQSVWLDNLCLEGRTGPQMRPTF